VVERRDRSDNHHLPSFASQRMGEDCVWKEVLFRFASDDLEQNCKNLIQELIILKFHGCNLQNVSSKREFSFILKVKIAKHMVISQMRKIVS
jgi:hypothetical protein